MQSCAVDSERQKALDAEAAKVQKVSISIEDPLYNTPNTQAVISDADMPLCNALETYLQALLLHYVSGTFLNTIKVNHGEKVKSKSFFSLRASCRLEISAAYQRRRQTQ